MAAVGKIIKNIEPQFVGQTDCRVLMVEGKDDKEVIEQHKDWVVAIAGSKENVIEIMREKLIG